MKVYKDKEGNLYVKSQFYGKMPHVAYAKYKTSRNFTDWFEMPQSKVNQLELAWEE